jgi:hypothetical protein
VQTSWAEFFGDTNSMFFPASIAMLTACGLELHVPFPAHQFFEIALRMHQRFQRRGNELPLHACADIFPSGYLNRPKHGFVLLLAAWISQQLYGFGVRAWSMGEFAQREQMQ